MGHPRTYRVIRFALAGHAMPTHPDVPAMHPSSGTPSFGMAGVAVRRYPHHSEQHRNHKKSKSLFEIETCPRHQHAKNLVFQYFESIPIAKSRKTKHIDMPFSTWAVPVWRQCKAVSYVFFTHRRIYLLANYHGIRNTENLHILQAHSVTIA